MATSYAVLAMSSTLDAERVSEILATGEYQRFDRIDDALPEIPPVYSEPVDFASEIEPVLDNSCRGCHTDDEPFGGSYSMDSLAKLIRGDSFGPDVVVPGNSAKSQLIHHVADRIEDVEMPPLPHRDSYEKLSREEISKIRRWIDDGLPGFDE